jgi:hypothetical protein
MNKSATCTILGFKDFYANACLLNLSNEGSRKLVAIKKQRQEKC